MYFVGGKCSSADIWRSREVLVSHVSGLACGFCPCIRWVYFFSSLRLLCWDFEIRSQHCSKSVEQDANSRTTGRINGKDTNAMAK